MWLRSQERNTSWSLSSKIWRAIEGEPRQNENAARPGAALVTSTAIKTPTSYPIGGRLYMSALAGRLRPRSGPA
jgi:hypothetical protein